MAVRLVQIVNPNGRKGWVAETSTAAAAYKQPPSARGEAADGLEAKPADKPKRRRASKTAASGAATTTASPESEED